MEKPFKWCKDLENIATETYKSLFIKSPTVLQEHLTGRSHFQYIKESCLHHTNIYWTTPIFQKRSPT